MGRAPCCEKVGLKRGPWTPEEDQKLVAYINENGHGSWRALPKKAGLLRCGKSCRLRWTNYLRPDIKRGEFSISEEQSIIQLHALLGNRWSAIASHLPKRTDNEIKNYWNTHLKKKLLKMGLDPVTHKPKGDSTLVNINGNPTLTVDPSKKDNQMKGIGGNLNLTWPNVMEKPSKNGTGSSVTNHMAQWESARLEAEARLAEEARLRAKGIWSSNSASLSRPSVKANSSLGLWSTAVPLKNAPASSNMSAGIGKATDLMNAVCNWEKSLQGQAVMMWPESRWLAGVHSPFQEVQAESSSCSSPCSDGNMNRNSSIPVTAGLSDMDRSSPTSTLCSLDSHHVNQKGFQSPFVSGTHMRKLSWNDALVETPLVKLEASLGFDMQQGVSCKIEEDRSTLSSLMQEAMINVDAVTSAFVCSQDESRGGVLKSSSVEELMDDEASCGENLIILNKPCSLVGKEQDMVEEDKDLFGEKLHVTVSGGRSGVIHCGSNSKEASSLCAIELKTNENVSSMSLQDAVDIEEEVDGTKDSKTSENENDHIDSQNSDVLQGMCSGGEILSTEMFKDLPKIKLEVSSTSHLSSFCTMLGDEIPDYWSSIMLREPCLQQVDMTF
ncbi:hypothetical protein KP509_34G036000 [Ceratopteris richardii]|uniref:Uncharacterized protein n=1 Tax=Ceratopteris richardii TaxID=49495 RepID=A0A8T2QKB1_CERRI|nr:hypothetical protein KP509_34G036000 [Ceratopteris richardii]